MSYEKVYLIYNGSCEELEYNLPLLAICNRYYMWSYFFESLNALASSDCVLDRPDYNSFCLP